MSTPSQFINPYEGLDNDTLYPDGSKASKRLQTYIDCNEYRHIQCIRPGGGTISTTFGLLFKKLLKALEARKIKDMGDIAAFEKFVSECELTTPGESQARPTKPKKKEEVV